MPKKISASNAAVSACISAAEIFGVPWYREQSRVFTVAGVGGRDRPMFVGDWTDDLGATHTKGKADLLMTPRVDVWKALAHLALNQFKNPAALIAPMNQRLDLTLRIAVPLWVECKSGSGKLEVEQKLFRDHVTKAGNFYIEAHDSADPLMEWFRQMAVRR